MFVWQGVVPLVDQSWGCSSVEMATGGGYTLQQRVLGQVPAKDGRLPNRVVTVGHQL